MEVEREYQPPAASPDHLIRFHGVLAPNASLRSQIMSGESDQAMATTDGDGDLSPASTRARISWAQLLKRVFAIDLTTVHSAAAP